MIGAKTTAYDLVIRGHCRPNPTGLDKKVGRVRFSFDVSRLPPAEVVNAFLAEHAPPVLDPFAGGGSIPLEAQRLGLRAYASDLNPVPVLINKALIEIPPKFAGRPPVNPASRPDRPSPDKPRAGVTEPVANARGSVTETESESKKLPSAPGSAYHAPDGPGAYFITFTTYGTWLPGDERSFVDREHNRPDEPRLVPDPERRRAAEQQLKHPPLVFDVAQRQRVLEAILEVCRYRGWWAHAVHVRTNHVHVVVSAAAKPEKVMNDFKSYATRGLRQSGLLAVKVDPVWTEHGSTRYLWNDAQFYGALTYVRDEQGERVAYGEGSAPVTDRMPSPDRQGVGISEQPVADARGSDSGTPSPDRQGAGDSEPVADARGSESTARSPRAKKQQPLMEHDWPGATGLAEDVRYYGQWMRDEAEKRIGHLYPKVAVTAQMAQDRPDLLPYVGQQLTVIAWLWARTVASQSFGREGRHRIGSIVLSTRNRTGNPSWAKPISGLLFEHDRLNSHCEIPFLPRHSHQGTPRARAFARSSRGKTWLHSDLRQQVRAGRTTAGCRRVFGRRGCA